MPRLLHDDVRGNTDVGSLGAIACPQTVPRHRFGCLRALGMARCGLKRQGH